MNAASVQVLAVRIGCPYGASVVVCLYGETVTTCKCGQV
jgi:hypothetical protein